MKYTDSHCHLDFEEFDGQHRQLLADCCQSGIRRIIVPGVSADRWAAQLTLCQRNPGIFAALGIHPWYIDQARSEHLHTLEHLLTQHPDVVAVGEIGIDGQIPDLEKQMRYFQKQLELAASMNLPVIIHHRKSHHLILPLLKQARLAKGGIIHAFSGSYQQAMAYVALGFKLGIGGVITYERAKKTIAAVKQLPAQALVLETDAPAMPLHSYQGQANSPLRLIEVFKTLVKLRGDCEQVLAQTLEENVDQLFPGTKSFCIATEATDTPGK